MGSLASQGQRDEVRQQVTKLLASSQLIYGSLDAVNVMGADAKTGAFLSPLLLVNSQPFGETDVHDVEAFGPVSTVMPYRNMDEVIEMSRMGKGSLCSSIVTSDDLLAREYVLGAATHHGRILVLNRHNAKESKGGGTGLTHQHDCHYRRVSAIC